MVFVMFTVPNIGIAIAGIAAGAGFKRVATVPIPNPTKEPVMTFFAGLSVKKSLTLPTVCTLLKNMMYNLLIFGHSKIKTEKGFSYVGNYRVDSYGKWCCCCCG
jgi:hypothetical protein